MHGVVMTFISWYIPTTLYCSERLLNNTKPQNAELMGTTDNNLRGLRGNIPKHAQISRPRKVTKKCRTVNDRAHLNPELYANLLHHIIRILVAKLRAI